MANELIPLDVRAFVLAHIDTIAQLEALLLLASRPDEGWTSASIAARLYIDETQAAASLHLLAREGLLRATDDAYRFEPENDSWRQTVERLAECYARHLIPVTNLVHGKPAGARAFAAAFKLRKDR